MSILLALLVLVTGACGSGGSSNKIAFSASVDGVSRLLIVNADGSGEATVAPEPSRVDTWVAWSPDGSHIAFRDADSKSSYLSVVRADGSHYARLYDDQNTGTASIWAGKGHQFAYVRPEPRATFTPAIFVVNPDGSGRRKLVDGEFPSWSPDGRKIAFLRCPFVRVTNSDGTGERKLVRLNCDEDGDVDFIAWASDSRKIAYTTFAWKNPKKTCETNGNCDYIDSATNVGLCFVHVVRIDESSQVHVVGGGLLGNSYPQCEIAWAPDGKKVAFTRNGSLYSVTTDGKRVRPLGARGLEPSWSPDGSHLAFLRNGTVYVLDMQRHDEHRLARADTTDDLSWSPDGKALVITRLVKPQVQADQGGYSPGESVIETMDADGGHVRRIWPKVGTCNCFGPAWQPHD